MTTMDNRLSAHFGTEKAAQEEQEQEKRAFEVFGTVTKTAGVNLEAMTQEQVSWLYDQWGAYQKTASENGIDLGKYDVPTVGNDFVKWVQKSAAEAKAQEIYAGSEAYAAKLAAEAQSNQQAFERGEFMGKVAAHSFVAALRNMENGGQTKQASDAPANDATSTRVERAREGLHAAGNAAKAAPGKILNFVKEHPKSTAAGVAGAVAAGVGTKMLHSHFRDKRNGGAPANDATTQAEKAAFEQHAGGVAVRLLINGGVSEKVANERIIEAMTQAAREGGGTSDTVKQASAGGHEAGVLARAAELIDLAGFELPSLGRDGRPRS